MAQTLKEEARQAIIEAAKEEFLEKGYKGASMRSIAKKSHMTVGNLYRYFKSKEDINLYIVAPTFKEIDNALKSLTKGNVSMETRVFNIKPSVKDLNAMLDELSDCMVNVYYNHKTEFNILMLHSRLSEDLINWFAGIIDSIISENFLMEGLKNDKDVLARAYAESICAGIRALFRDADSELEILKILLKTYFHSFISMISNDIKGFNNGIYSI